MVIEFLSCKPENPGFLSFKRCRKQSGDRSSRLHAYKPFRRQAVRTFTEMGGKRQCKTRGQINANWMKCATERYQLIYCKPRKRALILLLRDCTRSIRAVFSNRSSQLQDT